MGASATPETVADRISPLALGAARARGYSPDDVIANKNQIFQEIAKGLTPEVREAVEAAFLRVRDQEREEVPTG